jgi:hypothetical protein
MLIILSPYVNERLKYAAHIYFDILLKVPYKIFKEADFNPEKDRNPVIAYGITHVRKSLKIPDAGLLSQKGTSKIKPSFNRQDNKLFFDEEFKMGFDMDFDPFSACFFLLTEYEKYSCDEFDNHNRYKEETLYTIKKKLYKKPLINIYAKRLKMLIQERLNFRTMNGFKSDYQITIDVDHPFAFLHKGWKGKAGYLKDIIRFDIVNLKNRTVAELRQKDPYDTFKEILEICPLKKVLFFFLVGGKSKYDLKISDKKEYFKTIRELSENGFKIGLHPSYDTFKNLKLLEKEKEVLEDIIGKKVKHSRQHFLRYSLDETYTNLLETGITNDYTSCLYSQPGYKYGIMNTFPWYNLNEEKITDLKIHPTLAMDTTYRFYKQKSAKKSIKHLRNILDETRYHSGEFRILWHNSSLSGIHGWEKWENSLSKIISYIKYD